jgi:imidazolonepropionase-like amidohydrolase
MAIAAEAKNRHIPFVGHIPEEVTPLEASRAGQKSIEHLSGIKIEVARDPADLKRQRLAAQDAEDAAKSRDLFFQLNSAILDTYDPEKARDIFRQFARNGTWQSPTLVVLRAYATIHEIKLLADDRLAFMPQKSKETWSRSGGRLDPRNAGMQMRLFEQNLVIVNEMRRAGVIILAGTDAPNPYTFPGFSLHEELELLVRSGFSPMQALLAATRDPAEFLGQLKNRGTVEKGKVADLVLLDADPLLDIRNTKRIDSVIRVGRLIPKTELRSLLEAAKDLAR